MKPPSVEEIFLPQETKQHRLADYKNNILTFSQVVSGEKEEGISEPETVAQLAGEIQYTFIPLPGGNRESPEN